jgi:hypothetical protein
MALVCRLEIDRQRPGSKHCSGWNRLTIWLTLIIEATIEPIRTLAAAQETRVQTTGERSVSYEMWDNSASASRGSGSFLRQFRIDLASHRVIGEGGRVK